MVFQPLLRYLLLILTLLKIASCYNYDESIEFCKTDIDYKIFYGSVNGDYLGLSRAQVASIGKFVYYKKNDNTNVDIVCTGAIVSPRWVLTAKHCVRDFDIYNISFSTDVGPDSFNKIIRVVNVIPHPYLDISLAKLESYDAYPFIGINGISLIQSAIDHVQPGQTVEIVGYGVRENGEYGTKSFLVDQIYSIDQEWISTNGKGKRGACEGDSGAPMLYRDTDGILKIVGILSKGSDNCVGADLFVTADQVEPWVAETAKRSCIDTSCGTIDSIGRCINGRAVFCSEDNVVSEDCLEGTSCGWDDEQKRYACIPFRENPCQGIDGFGKCDENVIRKCNYGALAKDDCNKKGAMCRISSNYLGYQCVEDLI